MAAQPELVNTKLVTAWLLTGLIWLLLFPLVGLFASLQFNYPTWLEGSVLMSYPRLRQLHVNGVAWGAYTTLIVGLMWWMVPRLTGVRLFSERLAWWTLAAFTAAVIVGEVAIMAGYIQPLEMAEWPLPADILLLAGFVMTIINVFGTVFRRTEPHLYVTLWYIMAALIWSTLNYALAAFVLPYHFAGPVSAALHGFFLHNVVGLWITPTGVALAYYFLPISTRAPLYSHKLSLIGFWTIAFFYPMVGSHHYLFSPIQNWVQTVSIVSSMMLIVPVWTVVHNYYGTMRGHWRTFVERIDVKFLILGAVYYLLTCFQGPTQALRGMQPIVHFSDYIVGHAHLAIFGVFVLWAFAAVYHLWPRLTGREFSQGLALWHFWLTVLGFNVMIVSLWIAGLIQGAMLKEGADWVDTLVALRPYWFARTFGGAVMDLGIGIMAYNLLVWKPAVVPVVQPVLREA